MFAIPIQLIISVNYLSEKSFIFLKKQLARKESKVDLVESNGLYFPEFQDYFLPLMASVKKHQEALTFFYKNSVLLLYHIFLKFHRNMIIFFNRMSFGNSHELIIKCLIFSFSVISYLSFIFLPPCFFPLFFIISWDPARCNLPNHQEDQVLNIALLPP